MPPLFPEPLPAAGPPAGAPPSGPLALLRARWAVVRTGGRVRAGRGVALGRGVRWDLGPEAEVWLGPRSAIGAGTRFHVPCGCVVIGGGATLGERCVVHVQEAVTVGRHARFGDEAALVDHGPIHADSERPLREQGVWRGAVSVGDGARVGSRTVVGPFATVGDGAQVGANLCVESVAVAAGARVDRTPIAVGAPAPRAAHQQV